MCFILFLFASAKGFLRFAQEFLHCRRSRLTRSLSPNLHDFRRMLFLQADPSQVKSWFNFLIGSSVHEFMMCKSVGSSKSKFEFTRQLKFGPIWVVSISLDQLSIGSVFLLRFFSQRTRNHELIVFEKKVKNLSPMIPLHSLVFFRIRTRHRSIFFHMMDVRFDGAISLQRHNMWLGRQRISDTSVFSRMYDDFGNLIQA